MQTGSAYRSRPVAEKGYPHQAVGAASPATSADIHVNLPDAAMFPAPTGAAIDQAQADQPTAPVIPIWQRLQPAQRATTPVPGTPTVPVVPSGRIAATIASVLSSLGDAMSGSAPIVPTDAAVAAMLVASRREQIVSLGGAAATKATATATSPTTSIEAETLIFAPVAHGRVVVDRNASGGTALALTGSGTASSTIVIPASTGLVIRARSSSGSPNLTLSIDGVKVTTIVVNSTSYSDYTFAGTVPGGPHVLSISSSNATGLASLYLDKVTATNGSIVDDFLGKSGSAPDSRYWNVQTGSGWDGGIETYSKGNVYVDGQGHLVLQAARTKNGGYTSGWVDTRNKVSFGYGTITARIKVPKGQGLWPAFWLKGADEDVVAWPQSGEIDVLELPSTTTTIYSTVHGPIDGTTSTQQAQIISTLPDLSTDYHNYWVTHLENKIIYGVDNITLGTMTPDSLPAGSTWVYNRPMHVLLNLGVGGSWAGAPNGSTKFPASMLVESIRWDPVVSV